ncbi:helix-turn-helix domain-containing protein [Actinokineospora sp. 24-640]
MDGDDNVDTTWPLGPALRRARNAAGLSQAKAAKRAGVSRALWQQLEAGERPDGRPLRPKPVSLSLVARALDLDPRQVLEMAGLDPTAYDPSRAGRPVASTAEVGELLEMVTEVQRQAVVELLRAMVDPTGGLAYKQAILLPKTED